MSIALLGASDYLFRGSPTPLPTTGYPFTVGMMVSWFGTAANQTLYAFSDTATTANYLSLRLTSTGALSIVGRAGAAENVGTTTTVLPVSVGTQWAFCLGRFVSSTFRACHVFSPGSTTVMSAASATTARAPTGLDLETIGALVTSGGTTESLSGGIAEFWMANGDCFPGAYTTGLDQVVAEMALGGPFSNPFVRKNMLEYFSFRRGIGLANYGHDLEDEYTFGKAGESFWATGLGTTTYGPFVHPSLPYYYQKPMADRQVVRIV